MRPLLFPRLSVRNRLDHIAINQPRRRRFLGAALASAAILALPGCETPTFDPNTTTLTFRRRSYYDGGRN